MRTAAMTATTACPRCSTALEADDLRCPICGLLTDASRPRVERQKTTLVRCGTCGAAVSWSAEAGAPLCAYCGSKMHVESQPDPVEQAEATLPFRLDSDQAKQSLDAWLKTRGFFHPSDLASQASLQSLKPVWWPAWRVDARALVSWTADSNAGSKRADWAPHAGQTTMDFAGVLVPATRGLQSDECEALAGAYDFESAEAEPRGPVDAMVEPFEASRSTARKRVVEAIEEIAHEQVVQGEIPGTRHRNVHVVALLTGLAARRLSLPAWVLAYRYRDKLYRVVVHGQDAAKVVGRAPISWAKVLLVTLGALAGIAAIVGAIYLFGQR